MTLHARFGERRPQPFRQTPAPPLPVRNPHWLRRHRTIFLSDVHLGTRGCKAAMLVDFLQHNDCETLYLIGDIIDGWALKRGWYWDESHSDVVNAILTKVKNGTRVVYVPGNHDEMLRFYCGLLVAGVELQREAIHTTAENKRFLVVHGDRFDGMLNYARWLAPLGDSGYAVAHAVNDCLNAARRALGLDHWSLSAYLKRNVKKAPAHIGDFEQAMAREAKGRGFEGVVCGHIHHAAVKEIGGILYCNDGDWVESCTALVEDRRGRLNLLRWEAAWRAVAGASPQAPAAALAGA
jgi:UDP-2,3-diacylglucosamine pyrophosphatase LpxH